jgi:hypothetical protein
MPAPGRAHERQQVDPYATRKARSAVKSRRIAGKSCQRNRTRG